MSRSKSKTGADAYHHGDLRNALIAGGLALLEQEGVQALSMRKLARQAGVSHNAPYMHFADKEALLAAIAAEGFTILGEAVSAALAAAGEDWHERLRRAGWAYVQFALDHPAHLQVMFRAYDGETYPEQAAAALGALDRLEAIVVAGQAAGLVIPGDSRRLATLIWSQLHGIATILAAQKMPPGVMGDLTPEALTMLYLGWLYKGLAGKNAIPKLE